MSKCSVIVPMYRGKKYIEACIDSIITQTYTDWELILMNDGSPDDTYDFVSKIVDRYPDKDIRLLTQENKGVAETRNICVGYAAGKYVAFMDQDDTVEPDYLERLVTAAESNDADIAICGYIRRNDAGKKLKTVRLFKDSWSKYRIVAPWGRIYKKEFLVNNNLKYLTTPCGEDTYLTINAYAITDRIEILEDYTGYVWRYNEDSVSNTSQRSVKIADAACETFEKIITALPKDRISNPVDEEYFFIRSCVFYLLFSSCSESREQIDSAYDKYFSFLNKNFPNYKRNRHIGIFKPKSEGADVRFIIWAFITMQKLGLARAFVRARSKKMSKMAQRQSKN